MTISSLTNRKVQTADGVQLTFAYDYLILDASHLVLYHSDDLTTPLTGFTVTGVGSDAGGTAVFTVAPNAGTISLVREVPFTQSFDYITGGKFPADTHERLADLLVMMVQKLDDERKRSIQLPVTTAIDGLTLPEPVANEYLRWKADLSGFENFDIQNIGALSVSAFMQTLLDDANDSAARTTLKIQKHLVYNYIALGTPNALTVNIPDGLPVKTGADHEFGTFLIVNKGSVGSNTSTTVTLNLNSIGAFPVRLAGGGLPPIGSMGDGTIHMFYWDNLGDYWVLVNPINVSRGCLVSITTTFDTVSSSLNYIPFDTEDYDTDLIHDNVTNNTRLTVPAGVSKVRLTAGIRWDASTTGQRFAKIQKNGASYYGHPTMDIPAAAVGDTYINLTSSVVDVIAGDYFEVLVQQTSGANLTIDSANLGTWFAMEIIE